MSGAHNPAPGKHHGSSCCAWKVIGKKITSDRRAGGDRTIRQSVVAEQVKSGSLKVRKHWSFGANNSFRLQKLKKRRGGDSSPCD